MSLDVTRFKIGNTFGTTKRDGNKIIVSIEGSEMVFDAEGFTLDSLQVLVGRTITCTHPIESTILARTEEIRNCKGEVRILKVFKCTACGQEFSTVGG